LKINGTVSVNQPCHSIKGNCKPNYNRHDSPALRHSSGFSPQLLWHSYGPIHVMSPTSCKYYCQCYTHTTNITACSTKMFTNIEQTPKSLKQAIEHSL